MQDFSYRRPSDCAEAVRLCREEPDAKLLGGGMTLLPTMKQRLAAPPMLVDVAQLAELQGVGRAGDRLSIGGGVRHAAVAASPVVRAAIPGLASLAGGIGDPMVRNRGTLGGSLANNDPAADYPAGALALNARFRTDRREIVAQDFFAGLFATALEDGEILVEVSFQVPARSAYAKLRNQASRFATCGVFVAQWPDGAVTLAVTGAGQDGVFRSAAMERALTADCRPESLAGILPDEPDMLTDHTASGRYRAHLVNVMARRAVVGLAS
ncbi:MAG: carbon monoxide dehydrogenase [Caulobacteraceae bacterium]|nr:carbon monoxide dehydrogenase [Caulobacteraceae bacterium]